MRRQGVPRVTRRGRAEVSEGGTLDAPIADDKLHKMEQRDFAAGFPLPLSSRWSGR
ncbi:MAG TPA: hypothetical protein VG253_18995 [Streptosporangiaceae bacterium]|nr:hypothetical protein [Streptosporangiaceae bacterium]